MSQRGRPRVEIEKRTFEKLCGLHCTKEEIADFFECDADTLNAWCKREYKKNFSVVFREKRAHGNISLRRKQWDLAEKSPAMAIFLGKQYLGQSDKVEVTEDKDNSLKVGVIDLTKLSDEDLQTLKTIAKKIKC